MKTNSTHTDLFWVAAGGAIGAALRYGTGHFLQLSSGLYTIFSPTAMENILGSFLIGFAYTILVSRTGSNHQISLFLLTGIIGSYTTYSGFMVENLLLLQSDLILFAGYFVFQIGAGIAAAITGIVLGSSLIKYLKKSK